MKLTQNKRTGFFCLHDISPDEAASLLRMIQSACLPERRDFDRLKNDLKESLSENRKTCGLLSESGGRAHGREDSG